MRFKTLKFRRKKYFLYVLIMGVVLLLPLVLSITFGQYQTRESIKLAEGSITYKPYDFKIMAMYLENSSGEYQEINYTPTDGYKINEQKSYCTLDNINKDIDIILKTENGTIFLLILIKMQNVIYGLIKYPRFMILFKHIIRPCAQIFQPHLQKTQLEPYLWLRMIMVFLITMRVPFKITG